MLNSLLIPFAALYAVWLGLNQSLAGDVLLLGAAVCLILVLLFREGAAVFAEIRLTPRALVATLGYIGYFLRELVRANLSVAKIVLAPSLPVHPGIVVVRTALKSRMGRLMLANSITLTPGTLSVALEGEWLYVHWVNMTTTDVEKATAEIVAGFEAYLEVMYG